VGLNPPKQAVWMAQPPLASRGAGVMVGRGRRSILWQKNQAQGDSMDRSETGFHGCFRLVLRKPRHLVATLCHAGPAPRFLRFWRVPACCNRSSGGSSLPEAGKRHRRTEESLTWDLKGRPCGSRKDHRPNRRRCCSCKNASRPANADSQGKIRDSSESLWGVDLSRYRGECYPSWANLAKSVRL